MLTVGVAPLIGLDYGHLRDPRWRTEARWCLDRQHGAQTWLRLETIRLCKTYSPLFKDSTRIRESLRECDHSFVVYVCQCQVFVNVICQTITKRDRLPFTPTLGLSPLPEREGPELARNPGESLHTWPEASCLPVCYLLSVSTHA